MPRASRQLKAEASAAAMLRAEAVMPGGVSSPVRAFKAVGGQPLFIASGRGATIRDIDGNRFIDYVMSWGPLVLGHAHPKVVEAVRKALRAGSSFGAPTLREVELAERIAAAMPAVEQVRFVNSGTEAVMSAVRLARAATGRPGIIKFDGCYHGHADALLVRAGSGAMTFGTPSSPGFAPAKRGVDVAEPERLRRGQAQAERCFAQAEPGVPADTARHTHVATFNDLGSVRQACESSAAEIAAIIVEPVAGNMGVVPPEPLFLAGLRDLADRRGMLLVFDEVMTGFRVARGGATARYGVRPDLVTLGKVIGGGLPVGAYGGRRDLMAMVSPAGPVYQAGTLSGNPLAMAAGIATLDVLAEPGAYEALEAKSRRLEAGLADAVAGAGAAARVQRVGSMMTLFFSAGPVTDCASAMRCDTDRFGRFFRGMLARGVYLPPSQFEAWFVSLAHGEAELARTIRAAREAMRESVG